MAHGVPWLSQKIEACCRFSEENLLRLQATGGAVFSVVEVHFGAAALAGGVAGGGAAEAELAAGLAKEMARQKMKAWENDKLFALCQTAGCAMVENVEADAW